MTIDELFAQAGVDGRRLRRAVALLADGRWWSLADLVRETATSRRTIEALLRELPLEHRGERVRIPADQAKHYNTGTESNISDPVSHLMDIYGDTVARIGELIAKAPRGRHTLDHVAATADTVVRRALLLGERFWLPGARVLCVGDHDLTSLAVRMIHPEAEVAVADIDERILEYLDAQELGVRTFWADLRLGLPPSARGWADLAITDPPYTPEGVGLFVARAAEGLRDRDQGRILLAYGASERTPMLALKVQSALSDLNLLTEAIFPDFNRYHGAEAIGSAADLYVLRPTTKTWPSVASRVDKLATAIYTQGPQSVESARAKEDLPGLAGIEAFAPGLLVGDWPRDLLPKLPRVRLSTWLAKPYAADPDRVAIAVPPGLEAALPRVLLASRARHVRVLLATPPPDLTDLLSPLYDLTAEGTVLNAVRRALPDHTPARITRRILDNAHGKATNSWREALISTQNLTKKQARALIPDWADATTLELPAHRLTALPHAAAASLTTASQPSRAEADSVSPATHP
ncbi:bis-aminopropyl spermidine synthase family protein [Acrocarpospora pleiomorpha]|uniref:bis-aminopropyl spermidine synthase family protein n=2 Tax=Acrocarpospora pleiomorpha TaxID=90975 RepID=UPI0031D3FC41